MGKIIEAIILGLCQGLCEFLPVSSSGHLTVLQKAFGVEEGGSFFIVMLHLGTLLAVFAVYRKQIFELLKKPFQKKTYLLAVSTVTTVLIYLIGGSVFDNLEGNGIALGCSFLFTAGLLTFTDFVAPKLNFKRTGSITDMSYGAAIGVGAMQGIGILPGVSRSGSTIAGARLFGLEKEAAAEFSFLMSIPAILGGLVTEIPDMVKGDVGNIPWLPIIIGMAVAAVSGYFAIRFMIKLITKKRLWGFAVYVGALGIFLILDASIFNILF